jgi:hypothetical protein
VNFHWGISTFFASIALLTMSCNTRRPDLFLIPAGFKGWAKVQFQIASAPPLPVENGHWLLRLDGEGHLRTSSMLEGGVAKDEYFYVTNGRRTSLPNTQSCQGGIIWGVATGSDPISSRADTEWFFVGSEREYRQAIDPGGRIYVPCLDAEH